MYIETWQTDKGFEIDRVDNDGTRWHLGTLFELEDEDGEIYYSGTIDTREFSFYEILEYDRYLHRKFPNDDIVILEGI